MLHLTDEDGGEGRFGCEGLPGPSVAQRQLAELIEQLRYGCIDDLLVAAGDPRWEVRPRIRQIHLLAAPARPERPSPIKHGPKAETEFCELFRRLNDVRLALVSIVVQDGRPVRLVVHDLCWH